MGFDSFVSGNKLESEVLSNNGIASKRQKRYPRLVFMTPALCVLTELHKAKNKPFQYKIRIYKILTLISTSPEGYLPFFRFALMIEMSLPLPQPHTPESIAPYQL
jgi:hypothetical protein